MLTVSAGVIFRDDKLMLCRRKPGVHNGLMWEFPGGKLEPGESPEQALERELFEELDVKVSVGRIVDAIYFRYPDRDVLVLFYRCTIAGGEPKCIDCDAIAWAGAGELANYAFAGADAEFVVRNADALFDRS